ncbi:MAG: F0F1 ATP synthase subunit A [Lachnospiraceae bacterium]|jgi:F-type H+-transporting ATPase subunit a|nr:F0F1 ATP synthase subunit A [Lachnospiraceae bacterium]
MGAGILLTGGGADIDFMIKGVFPYQLFGQTLWITTTHICLVIVMLVIIVFSILAKRVMKKAAEVPSGFQNVVEMVVEMLDRMINSAMGKHAPKFRNYIGTLFIFILLSNISGLFGLRPPTADYGVTLALGLITFVMINFNEIKHQKMSGYFKALLDPWPIWMPINLISKVAIPMSLSLRLFANILSGAVMMALVYGMLSQVALIWPAALHVYFDLFSGSIQTYVFCMLTMTYIASVCETES